MDYEFRMSNYFSILKKQFRFNNSYDRALRLINTPQNNSIKT